MTNIEEQRAALNQIGEEMLNLCQSQFEHAFEAYTTFDTDLAEDILLKESRINALDLRLERDTDQFIALYNPVATDLRFALAILKINYNLERIGDQAFDIANHTIDLNEQLAPEIVKELKFPEMFETLSGMFNDVVNGYIYENIKSARKVFKKDKTINEINAKAFDIVAEEAIKHPELMRQYLMSLVVMKKFEKIGDLLKNISESIIYYIDAKMVSHKKKKK